MTVILSTVCNDQFRIVVFNDAVEVAVKVIFDLRGNQVCAVFGREYDVGKDLDY